MAKQFTLIFMHCWPTYILTTLHVCRVLDTTSWFSSPASFLNTLRRACFKLSVAFHFGDTDAVSLSRGYEWKNILEIKATVVGQILKSVGTRVTLSHPAVRTKLTLAKTPHSTGFLLNRVLNTFTCDKYYYTTLEALRVFGVLRRALPFPDSTTARSAAIFFAVLALLWKELRQINSLFRSETSK